MRTEKNFDIPCVIHEHELADQLLKEFGAFVGEVTKQKYTFLSPTEHLLFENEEFFAHQLPRDINLVHVLIQGPRAFIEVKHRTRFKNLGEVSDRTLNQVTIQGENPVAVRGLYERLGQILTPQRFLLRTAVYRFPLIFLWGTLVLIWFAEYRFARLLNPALRLSAPLTVLGAITLCSVAFGTLLVYVNFALSAFTFWFPYFEIDGNLSRHRLNAQRVVAAVLTSLLASGVWNLVSLLHSNGGH